MSRIDSLRLERVRAHVVHRIEMLRVERETADRATVTACNRQIAELETILEIVQP